MMNLSMGRGPFFRSAAVGFGLAVAAAGCGAAGGAPNTAAPATNSSAPTSTTMGPMAGMDHSNPANTGTAAPHMNMGKVIAGSATGASPCEKSGAPLSPGQAADGMSERGLVEQAPLDEATRHALQAQQIQARSVAVKYPTVADAEKAGYEKSTPYVTCIGAHYTNQSLAVRFDPGAPAELLFDGTNPDSRIVGLSFLVYHPGGAPEGFAGPNDHWHQHNSNGGLCLKGGFVVGSESSTDAECKAAGGRKTELTDIWMLHDWVVPGWECSWGTFSGECPELGGKTGVSAWAA